MARQAISDLIQKINREPDKLFKLLLLTRNHLVHAGSRDSLVKKIGMPLANAVNYAAIAAWRSIFYAMPPLRDSVQFGHRGFEFARHELVFYADMEFEYDGVEPHPSEDKIPKVDLSLQVTFRPEPATGFE
jgi:hypothetical protein